MKIPQSIDPKNINAIVNKWKDILDYSSKDVAEIQNEHVYRTTAILLENQERWCLEESNTAASGGIFGAGGSIGASGPNVSPNGDNYAQGDARLPKILIPMIRRTFPELISNEICGVQPMGGPVGLAFALRYHYQDQELLNCHDRVGCDSDQGTFGNMQKGVAGSVKPARGTIGYSGNGPTQAASLSTELGYQLLDTRFTGSSAAGLSGHFL